MTYAGLKGRAARKGARLERKGPWVTMTDAKNGAVIASLGGNDVTERELLLAIEDKVNWLDEL